MAKVTKGRGSKSKKPWEYIGKFIWSFGSIESLINDIFLALFELQRVSFMFVGLIDTRKKLKLIEIGFAEKGVETHKALLSELNKLHDLRNVLVHSEFFHEKIGDIDGLFINHVTHHGTRWSANKKSDNFMSFDDFERHFKRQNEIIDQLLVILEKTTPISSFPEEFKAAADKIIEGSPNVIELTPRIARKD